MAREIIVDAWHDRVAAATDLGATASMAKFVDSVNDSYAKGLLAGKLERAMDLCHPLTWSALQRWRSAFTGGGAAALAGHYGNRAGHSRIVADSDLHSAVLRLKQKGLRAPRLRKALLEQFGPARTPSLATIRRFISR